MNSADIVIAACTVITTLIAIKFWLLSGIENRLGKIEGKLDSVQKDLQDLDRRVATLEGYLMGRDFRNTGSNK